MWWFPAAVARLASAREYRTFIHRIAIDCSAVIELAMMIGHAEITIPYVIHSSRPITKIVYIDAEIAFTERDRQMRSNWGKKDAVVRIAAAVPRNVDTGLDMLVRV